ncbi:hypothetical protein [Streptomyces sp. NPDC054804]
MEHGGLAAPEQRARAVALGIPVTIRQPLLHDTAEVEEGFWGPERVPGPRLGRPGRPGQRGLRLPGRPVRARSAKTVRQPSDPYETP